MDSGSLSYLLRLLGIAIAVLVLVRLGPSIILLWKSRRLFGRLQKAGLPMPPHNALFGHLLVAKTVTDELPPGAHNNYILKRLSQKVANRIGDVDAYYFDPAPVNDPLLIVRDHHLAQQVTSHPVVGAQKCGALALWFLPITGRRGRNLFVANGAEWKHNNSLFQPFFSNANLDAVIAAVTEQFIMYREILRSRARKMPNQVFLLEPITLYMLNDVIGRLLLNLDLRNLTSDDPHPFSRIMLRQLKLKFAPGFSLTRKFETWNNGRILNGLIREQIDRHLQAYSKRSGRLEDHHDDCGRDAFTSVLSQALESYMEKLKASDTNKPPPTKAADLDPGFLEMLCAEIRMFFFAGYDSTASAISTCIYLIWRHPEILAKLRAEHDAVFGPNLEACMDRVSEDPTILNQLPYTLAVIKETMRVYPPAGGVRQGSPDLVLTGRDGTRYPTAGLIISINHLDIQRSQNAWVRPDEILPERFIVGPDHELYPQKGAWRAFEHGPRNCTGQALVLREMKAFLVLIAREFDFQDCYAETYKDEKIDLTHVGGELPYLVETGAAHMRGDFPCRVRLSGYVPGQNH